MALALFVAMMPDAMPSAVLLGGGIESSAYYGGELNNTDEPQISTGFSDRHTVTALTYQSGINNELSVLPAIMPLQFKTEIAAIFDGGDGESASTAYLISAPDQLVWLAEIINSGSTDYNGKYYKLTADIDLSGYDEGKGWTPIGTEKNAFQGRFDGSGYAVAGLHINDNALVNVGLFGTINGGTVQNLDILDADITGKYNVGGIAGSVHNGSVTNCRVTGEISGRYNVGGVMGYVSGSGNVKNCQVEATVSGGDITGGVAGFIYGSGSVANCCATGSVSGYLRIGGAAGRVDGSLANCYATGAVSGYYYIGGVAGRINKGGSVINCAALNPSVSDGEYTGRITGENYGGAIKNSMVFSGITINIGADDDGTGTKDIYKTVSDLLSSPGFQAVFTVSPWTYEAGGLPGLFGSSVPMPAHLLHADSG